MLSEAQQQVVQGIAGNVRELRRSKGLSQEALARKAGVSLQTVQRIEGAGRMASLDSLEQVASALGVNLKRLYRFRAAPRRAGESINPAAALA